MNHQEYQKLAKAMIKCKRTRKFSKTNYAWDEVGNINARKNVGSVVKLFNKCGSISLEKWINFYFDSGDEFDKLTKTEQKENAYEYGRSEKYLKEKIVPLFRKALIAAGMNDCEWTDEELYLYILIRVLYETWMGCCSEGALYDFVINNFPELTIKHTTDNEDSYFAVDFEILSRKTRNLLLGLQVKQENVQSYILERNKKLNERYTKEKGANVFYVKCRKSKILNQDELTKVLMAIA